MTPDDCIRTWVAAQRPAIAAALTELIAIPTENPPGRAYRECVEFLSRLLKNWGIPHQVVQVADGEYPRYSIVGAYGSGGPGLHFHGHYDVVAAQSPDQFRAVQRDGRLFGRGSSDMKGGIVAMLFAIRALQECGIPLAGPVTLTLVPDEETGGELGMRHLASHGLLPGHSLGMLMPEPSSGAIWHACRGALTLRVHVKGRAAHGALPHQGINAFEGMVRVIDDLLALEPAIESRRTGQTMSPPEARRSVMILGGACGSGASSNIVPEHAWFSIERRFNPEESLAQVKAELQAVFEAHRARGLEIETETFQESEASVAPEHAPLGQVLARAVEDVTGRHPPLELCAGVLETRYFNDRGIPGYGYGPGVLGVSHGPDEHVDLEALFASTAIYALTAARLLA